MINWQNGVTPINETNMNKIVQEDMIADAYSSSSTYAVGDYCIYENTLYKCTTAITTAEEFDSSKWNVASISYEFKRITNELSNKLNSNKVIQENGTASTSNVYSSKAVENLMKGTTLYDTENVNYSTVTLNDNISNYSYIEVIALNADNGIVSSGKIPVENGMLINLVSTSFRDSQNTLCFWLSTLLGSGNKLTPQTSKWFYFSNGYGGLGDGNYIGVTRVIGYK